MTFEKARRVGSQRRIWRALGFATLGIVAAGCAIPALAAAAEPDVNDTVGTPIAAGAPVAADAPHAADGPSATDPPGSAERPRAADAFRLAYERDAAELPLVAAGSNAPDLRVADVSAAADAGSPADAADSAEADGGGISEVIVTSRNREESSQDVPIPISVIQSDALVRDGTVSIQDLTQKAPGLEATTPNSRRTGIAIRGLGKSAGNDALEASVGVLVDGIFLTHPGMTYQDFTDLDRVEVLRGPQGTLLGKNTTIGALSFVTKQPSFTPEGSINVGVGERNGRQANGSFSNSIVDGVLAYRVSAFFDKQDGFLRNIGPDGATTSEKNRAGGRVQLLFTPFSGFSALINADYAQSDERSNTKPVIEVLTNYDDAAHTPRVTTTGGTAVPTTAARVATQNTATNTYASLFQRAYFGGYQPIVGSWDTENLYHNLPVLTRNEGVSATLNWKLGSDLALTLISGWRSYDFDAKNDAQQTRFDTGRNGTLLTTGQESHEFRLSQSIGSSFDYQAGLYFVHFWNQSTGRTLYGADSGAFSAGNGDYDLLYSTSAGQQLLRASLQNVYVTNKITPDTGSYAAFGQANWHFTDRGTLTFGVRETYERKMNTSTAAADLIDGSPLNNLTTLGQSLGASALQIASANNIRTTSIGPTYATVTGIPIKAYSTSWLFSPSYKLTERTMVYASAAAGQKSGSVQFTSSGKPLNVAPEKTLDFEIGIKSQLLNDSLQVDLDLFQTRVRDYQQTTSIFDAATTTLKNNGTLYYQSILGNIPEIMARGAELEGAWLLTKSLTLNYGFVYNHAVYANWDLATCPNEANVKSSTTTCNNTGRQIVGAPRFTSTVALDYHQGVFRDYEAHFWAANVYRSQQNFDNNLSRYGIQGAYGLTDAGIGFVTPDKRFELDFVGRNVFNKRYTTSVNVNSNGSIGYDGIGDPRWVGVELHAKL
jgi:iron complex outermembrane recepter protein